MRLKTFYFLSAFTSTTIHSITEAFVHRIIAFPQQRSLRFITSTSKLNMGWADTWDDILQGGSQRWKILCPDAHSKAVSHIHRHLATQKQEEKEAAHIFCPLAGDDPVVHLLWKQGHHVTSIDLVPAAVAAMRNNFEGEWTEERQSDDGTIIWKHESSRATLYEGDALKSRPELYGKFDAVYDKDSFGALNKEMREGYIKRLAEYTKKGSIVYIEVKLKDNHEQVKDIGPPFSLKKDDLMESYKGFQHVEDIGVAYDIPFPGASQTAHVLRRE